MFKLLWSLTVRPLCQDRRRSTISVFGIALGIALIFSVNLSIERARESIRGGSSFLNLADREIASRFGEGIPADVYAKTLTVPGLMSLPVLLRSVNLEPGYGETLLIATDLVKLPYFTDQSPGLQDTDTVLEAFRSSAVYVSPDLYPHTETPAGLTIQLNAGDAVTDLFVLGTLPSDVFGERIALADISVGERFFGQGIDRILIRVTDRKNTDKILQGVESELTPDLSLARPYDRILRTEDVIRSFENNLRALSFMVLLIGMFLVYNTIFVSVVRRRSEIGILRALGMTRRQVMTTFILEAGAIGTIGSTCGIFFGLLLVAFSDQGVAATLRSLYDIQLLSTGGTGPNGIIFPLTSGIMGSMLASLRPAYEAASIPPVEAMREGGHAHRDTKTYPLKAVMGMGLGFLGLWTAFAIRVGRFPYAGFAGLLVFILGFVLTVPWITTLVARRSLRFFNTLGGVEGRLGTLNLVGSAGRTSMAVAAIAVSLACTVGILMLIHSFRVTVEDWVDGNLSADVYIKAESCGGRVFCDDVLDADTLERLGSVPGVAASYRFRTFEFELRGQKTHLGFSDVSTLHRYSRLRYLYGGDPVQILTQLMGTDSVLVSEPFANRFEVRPGDVISIPTRAGEKSFRVSGVFLDYSTELGYMIADRRFLQPLFGVNDAHTAGLYFDGSVPGAIMAERIRTALGGKQVVFFEARELRAAVLSIFDRTFAVTRAIYAIALTVALLAVANTLFALMVDRRRDIAVLRYLGMERRQLFRMILSESSLIGLIGSTSGFFMGGPVGLVLIYVINQQSFGWSVDFHLPYGALAGITLGMFLMTVACSWLPYRFARGMSPSMHVSYE